MNILNRQQMLELEQRTLQAQRLSPLELMERAATAFCRCVAPEVSRCDDIVVFAGPGNNGGDALASARLLAATGKSVTAYLFNTGKGLSAECEANRDRLRQMPEVSLSEIRNKFDLPQLGPRTLVVDGLFGTGLNKPLSGGFGSLVQFINASAATVVSIDMPSGLMTDDNSYNIPANIVRAGKTVTFHAPKLAHLMADCQEFVGQLETADIGLLTDGPDTDFQLTEEADVRRLLKPRPAFGHKGTFGHALLVAGQYGMAGAAVLAARACLRSGVGKVTMHTPRSNTDILQLGVPEAVLSLDNDATHFATPLPTDGFSALGIGPGLGTEQPTAVAFIEQVRRTRIPLVIDADGLNILAAHKGWIQQIPAEAILTPHPKEMQRMGTATTSYATLSEARELARRHHLHIVLKGHRTAVCTPEGRTFFNPTGNSGMATAGSGDVLTGIITALLAQRYTQAEACRLGVYLHGLAGDLAAQRTGEESLTASDIIEALPAAFQKLKSQPSDL